MEQLRHAIHGFERAAIYVNAALWGWLAAMPTMSMLAYWCPGILSGLLFVRVLGLYGETERRRPPTAALLFWILLLAANTFVAGIYVPFLSPLTASPFAR